MSQAFVFDSGVLSPGERFDAYYALYAAGADAGRADGGFAVRMAGVRLDRGLIYHRHLRGVVHRRDPVRVRRDPMDHLTLTLVVAGEYYLDAGNGFANLAPGEIVVLDMTRPTANAIPGAQVITWSVAREAVALALGEPRALHGRIVRGAAAVALAQAMHGMHRLGETADEPERRALVQGGIAELTAALGGGAPRPPSPAEMRLARMREYIETRLFVPGFGPTSVLLHFAVSRATAYRDFAPWGGLAAYIRARRIEALSERLSDRGDRRSLSELAAAIGFSTEARQSEAFLTRFGMRPGTYRRRIAAEGDVARAWRLMREWQALLR